MTVSASVFAVGGDIAGLEAAIAAKIALGYQPSPTGQIIEVRGILSREMFYGTPVVTNSLEDQTLTTPAGAGITGGTGTIYENSVHQRGGIVETEIIIDLTGLASSTTDLDIIGQGASAAHLGRITAAQNGTVLHGFMQCLEVPVGGADDIDLYAATEGTGVFDGAVATLTETALITSGGAWTLGQVKALSEVPAANQYLYLTGGEAGTAATYTAGKFRIFMQGYHA